MTYVIAEVGSNYRSRDEQVASVRLAARAGADCVKFQAFTRRELYGHGGDEVGLRPDLEFLAKVAAEHGIDFMCTAFSAEGVAAVDAFVRTHKVASAEMCDTDILDAVARTGKPIMLSTGGHTMREVHQVLDYLGPVVSSRTTLLYCESAYPAVCTMPEKVGLLQRETGLPVGLSDHSREIFLSAWLAQYYSLPVVEKHVNLVGATGSDAPHSLDFDEFRRFVEYLKNDRYIVSDLLSLEESDMVTKHNRRIVATCDIAKGALLSRLNFGFYRGTVENGHALSPLEAGRVKGKAATRDIKAGECICDGDFE